MMRVNFTTGFIVLLLTLKGATCSSERIIPSSSTLASRAFNRFLNFSKPCRNQMERTSLAETNIPCFRSSVPERDCPWAGNAIACVKTAFSVTSSTRFLRLGVLLGLIYQRLNTAVFNQLLIAIESITGKPHDFTSSRHVFQFFSEIE